VARMYPPVIADDHGSHAERRIFNKLRDETPNSWTALHSVGLASHSTKPWAEIDFVVVADQGVFCLEVKGGEIEHREGDWYTNGNRLKQSPFAQAGGGSSALYEYLAARVPAVRRSLVGYGVMFPDTKFVSDMPEVEHRLIYDDRDLQAPLGAYLARLTDYWNERMGGRHGGRLPDPLTLADRSRIVHEIAPDFDLVPTLRARVAEVDEELVRLTERQKELLEGLIDEPRVVVKGGAGTGKTLLACEEAIRLARQGKRTMFLCYGSRLASHLRAALAHDRIEVEHLHGLMARLIQEADLGSQLPAVDERDLFDIYYPQVAIEALAQLSTFGSVDALVIDEGQDLLKPTYVQFLDALLKGEMSNGAWRLFYDPNQDIFMGGGPQELERLEQLGVCYRLTRNCRNTREIALATSFVSGVRLAETLVVEGPDVVEEWGSESKQLQKCLLRVLREWLDRGLEPQQITILSPRSYERSLLASINPARLPRRVVDLTQSDPLNGRIHFSTIAGFKGLEADAVLLIDIYDLSSPEQLALLYTGTTRAKILLGLVLHESCRELYTERVGELVGRLIEQPRRDST
jgi:Nuclease-related domain/UvrD-like helicase C-terminal domain/AAA domain